MIQTPDKIQKYTTELARRLRLRGMNEKEVEEAVRIVASRSANSGTSPWVAFGTPRTCAERFAPRPGSCPTGIRLYIVAWFTATLAGYLLILSIYADKNDKILGFLPRGTAIFLACTVLLLWASFVAIRIGRRPRTTPPCSLRTGGTNDGRCQQAHQNV